MSKYMYTIAFAVFVSNFAWSMDTFKNLVVTPITNKINNPSVETTFSDFVSNHQKKENLKEVLGQSIGGSLITGTVFTLGTFVAPFPVNCILAAGMVNSFANAVIHIQNGEMLRTEAYNAKKIRRFLTSFGVDITDTDLKKELEQLSNRTCINPDNYLALWYLSSKKGD